VGLKNSRFRRKKKIKPADGRGENWTKKNIKATKASSGGVKEERKNRKILGHGGVIKTQLDAAVTGRKSFENPKDKRVPKKGVNALIFKTGPKKKNKQFHTGCAPNR